MKIEKLSDNQIRCTLTRADLADRQLKLSELVCGTEKAKSLFHEMMEQAAEELGFEADNIPLMIEAIPTSADSIVLLITKVDEPEELDAKFSKFGAPGNEASNKKRQFLDKLEGADALLELLDKVKESVASTSPVEEAKEPTVREPEGIRLFSFANMDSVIHGCHLLQGIFDGGSTLYKDTSEQVYLLALTRHEHSATEFNKICNMLSEYGSLERSTYPTLAYLEEHCEVIVGADAVQHLGQI